LVKKSEFAEFEAQKEKNLFGQQKTISLKSIGCEFSLTTNVLYLPQFWYKCG